MTTSPTGLFIGLKHHSYGTTDAEKADIDRGQQPSPMHARVILFSCFLCLTCVAEGYDIGVLNGALVRIKDDLGISIWESSTIVMVTPLFVIPGSLLGGQLADHFGRKGALIINSLLLIIGPLGMALAQNVFLLIAARCVVGFSIGVAYVVVSMYVAEVAPRELRGSLNSLADVFLNVGIVVGYTCCWLLRGMSNDWRLMLVLGSVLPIIVLLTLLLPQIPESPRWLFAQGRDTEAEQVLESFVGSVESQRDMQTLRAPVEDKLGEEKFVTWGNLLSAAVRGRKNSVRQKLLAGCSVVFASTACGYLAVAYYSSSMLKHAMSEDKAFFATIIMGVVKLIVVILAMAIIERVGRRPLVLLSCILTAVASAWLAIAFAAKADMLVLVIGLCLFMAGFSLGLGPVTFAYATEVFDTEWRGKALGVAFFVSRIAGAANTLLFPVVAQGIGLSNAFWIQFAVCVVLVGLLWALVFETKGQQLDNMKTPE